jgi:glycine cleavage system T protein
MAKQSPLFDLHTSNGAVFEERDGWLLPLHFGNSAAEYQAARSAAGFIDLSHRGMLQFTGPDRLSYLQGLLSNDLTLLKPYAGQYATLLNQQGKVLGDGRVLCSLNSFYLDFWEAIKDKILAHLSRYLVADEVEIADRTEGYGILSIQGPHSEALLSKLIGQAELPLQLLQHAMVNLDNAMICLVRDSHTGEDGFDLIIPKADLITVAQRLTEIGKSFSAGWLGEEAQEILRVEAGVPRYGIDVTEDNLVLETGLDNHVSFNKGCYLGQEVVERIRSRGHVNKKLVGLSLKEKAAATRGDKIMAEDKVVGAVTSSIVSPALGHAIALGYVQRDYWHPGSHLGITGTRGSMSATVTSLPFVKQKSAPNPGP